MSSDVFSVAHDAAATNGSSVTEIVSFAIKEVKDEFFYVSEIKDECCVESIEPKDLYNEDGTSPVNVSLCLWSTSI